MGDGKQHRMPTNIEIKAAVCDLQAIERRLLRLGAFGPQMLVQCDTFFNCGSGRLKMREIAGQKAELIIYARPDSVGPKISRYIVLPVDDSKLAHEIMSLTHGCAGFVKKTRKVFFLAGARVHLDKVERLGTFVEIEVVLSDDYAQATGWNIMAELLDVLQISQRDMVAEAYIDLVKQDSAATPA
jgi:predicted adenylyl cyclase CyaB